MTRANTEQIKHTPWFAKAGAACSIVPIARFVSPNIFALKGGGYGYRPDSRRARVHRIRCDVVFCTERHLIYRGDLLSPHHQGSIYRAQDTDLCSEKHEGGD
jgi:hypothetical protein